MENNNEKKLYTLLVYSENIAGILNQITAVFTRRQVNIESLNVSASSIKNIHKYTITVWSDEEQIEKINSLKTIEKFVKVGDREGIKKYLKNTSDRKRRYLAENKKQ